MTLTFLLTFRILKKEIPFTTYGISKIFKEKG